jgi:hypothetical protein
MFVLCEGVDAVNVGGGVRAREGDPEEVAEGFGNELRVVDDEEDAEAGKGRGRLRNWDFGLRIGVLWAFDCEDAGQDETWVFEGVGELKVGWEFGGEFEARRADGGDYDF